MLGSELWEDDFGSLLSIVKEFLVDVWECRKLKLYGDSACPGPQPNSLGWDLGQDGKLWNGRNGRSGELSHSLLVQSSKFNYSRTQRAYAYTMLNIHR